MTMISTKPEALIVAGNRKTSDPHVECFTSDQPQQKLGGSTQHCRKGSFKVQGSRVTRLFKESARVLLEFYTGPIKVFYKGSLRVHKVPEGLLKASARGPTLTALPTG